MHLPRIGHSTPGFNWYGTERLIRKHLASKGIKTLIYPTIRSQTHLKRNKEPELELLVDDALVGFAEKLHSTVLNILQGDRLLL